MAMQDLVLARKEESRVFVARATKWVVDAQQWSSYVSVAATALAEYLANQEGKTIYESRVGTVVMKKDDAFFGTHIREAIKTLEK